MEQRINKILEAAIRAPSGDNTQPWRFEVSIDNQQIDLFNVPERDPSYLNYKQLASYVAHGALIENMLIAAKTVGCNMDISLFPNSENEEHVAKISLKVCAPRQDPLYDAIFRRVTNRNQFKPISLTEEQLQLLRMAANTVSNATVTLISEAKVKNNLAWNLRKNDQFIFEHREAHDFLFKQIRWSKRHAKNTCDGMPIENLGLGFLEKPLFPIFKYWPAVKFLNILGLSHFIGLKGWMNYRSSAILGMVSVTRGADKKETFLTGGRAAQRVWLESTRQGFSFQPVTGLTFLNQRYQREDLTGFNAKQKLQIEDACGRLKTDFNIKGKVAVFGFRIGKSDSTPPFTLRRPV